MSIGEQIRIRREELGLSQAELAKRIGITQGSVGNYESGVSNPKMELMPRLFDALETDANFLFGEMPPENDITYSESIMIKKHRVLDEHGKKVVDFVLDEEFERCQHQAQVDDQSDGKCSILFVLTATFFLIILYLIV